MVGLQSYDLMVNPKYRRLDRMLFYMRETFGYNDDFAPWHNQQSGENDELLGEPRRPGDGSRQVQDLVNHLVLQG